jgi:nucleotide-binding universal stress UspA family protein
MIKKILAAVDFSDCAGAALQSARELARSTGAELVLVFADEFPVVPVADPSFMPAYMFEEHVARGRERFAQLVEQARDGIVARGYTAVGPAREVVAEAIATEKPDLVVTGCHGRHALGRMFLGSFAEHLTRTSPVPVLTVHAH